MALEYTLSYAGVPLLADTATSFRMAHGLPEQEDKQDTTLPPRKHQPDIDFLEEIDRLHPFRYHTEFSTTPAYFNRNLQSVARRPDNGSFDNPVIRINEWFYPNNASRWSVFRGLASSSQINSILRATNGITPATFEIKAHPDGAKKANTRVTDYTVSTSMYCLPPRPLAEHGGEFDGLYLITLVDERYQWQYQPVSLRVRLGTTWQNLIDDLATALGVSISLSSSIENVYSYPNPDSQLWCNFEAAPVLLDAIAWNIGRVLVRNLAGTYTLLTPTESRVRALANRGTSSIVRTAGGDIFTSGIGLNVGNLNPSKNSIVPSEIKVSFPLYVFGDDPVPHFFNSRTQKQRPSAWFEDSYGDVYSVTVPIRSGGLYASGLSGTGTIYFQDTAKALISGEANLSGTPINASGLVSLSMQLAANHYGQHLAATLDETYPGILNLSLDGLHDVVWTYSTRRRQASTRVIHQGWGSYPEEFQHAAYPMSGGTTHPRGVGGLSVAQSIKDNFFPNAGIQVSGNFTSGQTISSGYVASGSVTSGSIVGSGGVCTTLSQTLNSGDFTAVFGHVNFLPTQNRWRGQVDGEIILFEGTSGGINSNTVTITYRGIDGTVQTSHDNGARVCQVLPNVSYGVNLTDYEKGQLVHPSHWTSGGIQGVNVLPQTQTVNILDDIGTAVSGIMYYSGHVDIYDVTRSNPWVRKEYIWAVERNSGSISVGRMAGQIAGYSPAISTTTAPVYLVSEGGGGDSDSFLVQITGVCYYDGSGDRDDDDLTALGTGEITCEANIDCQNRHQLYSWAEMIEGESLNCPMTYTKGERFGSFSCDALKHLRKYDLPPFPEACPVVRPSSTGSDGSGGDVAWTNPESVSSQDGSAYATCVLGAGQVSNRLFVKGFCYGIAGHLTPTLVEFRVTAKATGGSVTDTEVKLLVNGSPVGTNKAAGGALTTSDAVYTYSYSPTDWGYVGLTPLEINSAEFGISLQYTNGSGESRTDCVLEVECRLTYTPDGIDGLKYTIYRVWRGDGGELVFDANPWVELIRRTDETDANGYIGYPRYRDPNDSTWKDDYQEVRVIVAE